MPIQHTCGCGKKLGISNHLAGRKIKCPGCGGVIDVPTPVAAVKIPTVATVLPPAGPSQPPDQSSPPRGDTKDCPFCGETILATAKKCKHCKEFLDGQSSGPGPASVIPPAATAPAPTWNAAWNTPAPPTTPAWNEPTRGRPGYARRNDDMADLKADRRAIWGFICGLISILAGWLIPLGGFFLSLAAIIHSSLGLRSPSHKGLAVAGLILGIICFLFYGLLILGIVALASLGFFG